MKLYTVTATSISSSFSNQYVVGVYSDKRLATRRAVIEEYYRAGAYTCKVEPLVPNSQEFDVMAQWVQEHCISPSDLMDEVERRMAEGAE